MHDVFHVSMLKLFKQSDTFKGREMPNVRTFIPDTLPKTEDWYIVKAFLETRKQGKQVSYKVRWEGYEDSKFDTWEPAKLLRKDLGAEAFSAFVEAMEKSKKATPVATKTRRRPR